MNEPDSRIIFLGLRDGQGGVGHADEVHLGHQPGAHHISRQVNSTISMRGMYVPCIDRQHSHSRVNNASGRAYLNSMPWPRYRSSDSVTTPMYGPLGSSKNPGRGTPQGRHTYRRAAPRRAPYQKGSEASSYQGRHDPCCVLSDALPKTVSMGTDLCSPMICPLGCR
jgi:hypothetical protein